MCGLWRYSVLWRGVQVGRRRVELEPELFKDVTGGPPGLVGIVCNVLGREDVGPDKFHDIIQVHIVDFVADAVIVAVDRAVPLLHPEAEAGRRDTQLSHVKIVAALKKTQHGRFGEHGESIFAAGFFDERVRGGAAAAEKTDRICSVVTGVVDVEVEHCLFRWDQGVVRIVIAPEFTFFFGCKKYQQHGSSRRIFPKVSCCRDDGGGPGCVVAGAVEDTIQFPFFDGWIIGDADVVVVGAEHDILFAQRGVGAGDAGDDVFQDETFGG